MREALPELLDEYTNSGDDLALAKTHMLAFWMYWDALDARAAGEARLAAGHAGRAQSEQLRQWALLWYLAALAEGSFPIALIAAAADDAEREQGADLAPLGFVRGEIARRERRYEDAWAELDRAAGRFDALGQRLIVAACRLWLSRVEVARGDLGRALELARESDAILLPLGERGFRSTVQAEIASLTEQQGDADSARAAIALSRELGTPGDLINTIVLDSVLARLALGDGDLSQAERYSRLAVAAADGTDSPLAQRYAQTASILVLRAAGDAEGARAGAQRLLSLYSTIGDLKGIEDARALIAEIGGGTR